MTSEEDLGGGLSTWEMIQADMLEGLPTQRDAASSGNASGCWLWCGNPGCTNMSGPSELQLKTLACGGGFGVRYCGRECQEEAWRAGHRCSCARLRDNRAG